MKELTSAAPEIAHIDALLDDPMTRCIMAIDRIDRDDARRLFQEVALRLRRSVHPGTPAAEPASSIFFVKDARGAQVD